VFSACIDIFHTGSTNFFILINSLPRQRYLISSTVLMRRELIICKESSSRCCLVEWKVTLVYKVVLHAESIVFFLQLADADHYDADGIRHRRDEVLERWRKLKEALLANRERLGEAQSLQQFSRDVDEMEIWITEKLQTATDESYKDPSNIQVSRLRFIHCSIK